MIDMSQHLQSFVPFTRSAVIIYKAAKARLSITVA